MQRFLSLSEVAERLGWSLNTAKSYLRAGRLPEPDALTGRVRGWLPETIADWDKQRPGPGARTDRRPTVERGQQGPG